MKQKSYTNKLRTSNCASKKAVKSRSLVEQSIIALQNSFLTPGLHCITVSNVQHGRDLLKVCLDSLGRYTDIGLVSHSAQTGPSHYTDLYTQMSQVGALSLEEGMLEDYMLSSFQSDFLILEYTQELMVQPWFGKFEQLLSDYSITNSIPVVMFLYEEQTLNHN